MNFHTTLDGFKRAAKRLTKHSNIPLHQAQEQLARIEGYANYHHAQRVLREQVRGFRTTFFMNWQKERGSSEGGCFEASVWTRKDPKKILTPSARRHIMQLQKERNLSLYRITGYGQGEDQAKWYVGRCLRFMQFCDTTGLTPGVSAYRRDPDAIDRCPWSDHRKHWWDAENKTYIITDEPYESRLMEWKGRTQDWGDKEGFDTLESGWGSLWNQNTYLVFACKKDSGVDLKNLNAQLMASPPPIYPEAR